jgi:hypothetical protein
MQALGSYAGDRMLFLGLGTSLGSALVSDRVIVPLEIGQLPFKKKQNLEDCLGREGLRRLGLEQWREAVQEAVAVLRGAFVADYVVLSGGNAKRVKVLPSGCRRGDNGNAFEGGFRLWETEVAPTHTPRKPHAPRPPADVWRAV